MVVWNVIFDQVIVVAGRGTSRAALAAAAGGPYARIDDWMRPAVTARRVDRQRPPPEPGSRPV